MQGLSKDQEAAIREILEAEYLDPTAFLARPRLERAADAAAPAPIPQRPAAPAAPHVYRPPQWSCNRWEAVKDMAYRRRVVLHSSHRFPGRDRYYIADRDGQILVPPPLTLEAAEAWLVGRQPLSQGELVGKAIRAAHEAAMLARLNAAQPAVSPFVVPASKPVAALFRSPMAGWRFVSG